MAQFCGSEINIVKLGVAAVDSLRAAADPHLLNEFFSFGRNHLSGIVSGRDRWYKSRGTVIMERLIQMCAFLMWWLSSALLMKSIVQKLQVSIFFCWLLEKPPFDYYYSTTPLILFFGTWMPATTTVNCSTAAAVRAPLSGTFQHFPHIFEFY